MSLLGSLGLGASLSLESGEDLWRKETEVNPPRSQPHAGGGSYLIPKCQLSPKGLKPDTGGSVDAHNLSTNDYC